MEVALVDSEFVDFLVEFAFTISCSGVPLVRVVHICTEQPTKLLLGVNG